MRIIALDVGDKKIGLAIGDTSTRMAFTRPALLVQSWSDIWEPLQKLVTNETIELIVIGWPFNIDGSIGSQAGRVEEFIQALTEQTSVPIIKRDERHTSQAVQREQQSASRKLARGEEDSLAAQLLLESYLSEKS